jgi:hypothetical protein
LTGVGFFTHFSAAETAPRAQPANLEIGDVFIEVEGLEARAGWILFIRVGTTAFPDVPSIVDSWPKNAKRVPVLRGARRAAQPFAAAGTSPRFYGGGFGFWRA